MKKPPPGRGFSGWALGSARLQLCQVLPDKIPVHEMVEKGLDEIGPPVLVIEIVGVLPDIAGQEGRLPERDRVDPVQGVRDLEFTLVGDEPGPAAAELIDRGLLELLLELVHVAEIALEGLREVACWRAAAIRLQAVPEEIVVPYLG